MLPAAPYLGGFAGTERPAVRISSRERTISALMALAIVAAMAAVLALGLRVNWRVQRTEALIAIGLERPRPEPTEPPQPEPRKTEKAPPERASAPGPAREEAAPVVASRLPPLIVLPPVPAATQASAGEAAQGGGAGGTGNGTGGGGTGEGTGGLATQPRQIGGRLKFSDLPHDVLEPGKWAEVGVRYVVEANGRVRECAIDASSGVPELDAVACRLIVRRFRFRPARDAAGRPVRATITETHGWFVRRDERR